MALQLHLLQLPLLSSSSSTSNSSPSTSYSQTQKLLFLRSSPISLHHHYPWWKRDKERGGGGGRFVLASSAAEDTELEEQEQQIEPTEEDLEYVRQIQRVLGLLKKNRDMLFSEVKLTIMIEDPREIERRRMLGIEYSDEPTRDDLAAALEEVNEGRVPKDRAALRMLAEEITQWPNLEVEATKKKPGKSKYAKATDTGVDPQVAAKRLNMDWDSAAEIEEAEGDDETEVPALLGYGALYLVSAFPLIIGISVVLILFYNSLQ